MKQGNLIIFSAPSGTGKGTVLAKLFEKLPDLAYSVSWTTRAPRSNDIDGVTYIFKTEEEFQALVDAGGFFEYAGVHGNRYGTPIAPIEAHLAAGRDVILEIDTQGALQVMAKRPDALSIFLLPPSMKELHHRLASRGTETPEKVQKRFAAAYGELEAAKHYDYCVVNDRVDDAADAIFAILRASSLRRKNYESFIQSLREETVL